MRACSQGDFSQRVDLNGKTGATRDLCEGVNEIGEVAERGLEATRVALTRLSDGDLTHCMGSGHLRVFAAIGLAAYETAENLSRIVG